MVAAALVGTRFSFEGVAVWEWIGWFGGGLVLLDMAVIAAGIVMYRRGAGEIEVLLVHPGGPVWAHKDLGGWSIPKGKVEKGEELWAAALREFREETGWEVEDALCDGDGGEHKACPQRSQRQHRGTEEGKGTPGGSPVPREPGHPLTPVRQRSGKVVHAWAVEGTIDVAGVRSNVFEMEWPPRSGVMAEFPEIDRAEFFGLPEARRKIHGYLVPLLDELERTVGGAAKG
jgi:predicted NUDIX family NTP pyrophosphohydrolase